MTNEFKLIESLMYVQGIRGIGPSDLKAITEMSVPDARKMLKDFAKEYNDSDRGLMVVEFNDLFKFATREEFKDDISKLVTIIRKRKLSNSALETIGIIAYKQPITKSQVNEIRGMSSEAVVNSLLTKGLIEEKGIAKTPGSPVLYGVSDKFYDYFQISSLRELPQLSEFDESEGVDDEDFDLFSSQRGD